MLSNVLSPAAILFRYALSEVQFTFLLLYALIGKFPSYQQSTKVQSIFTGISKQNPPNAVTTPDTSNYFL